MKRALLILGLALLVGAVAFFLPQLTRHQSAPGGALIEAMPELAWLRGELGLSDEQFAKVSALHAGYRPQCEAMCERIAIAHQRMDDAARNANGVTPELAAEIADHARIHADCQRAMLDHLYRTAAVLDKDQAKTYLNEMLPYALDFSHSEPEGAHAH